MVLTDSFKTILREFNMFHILALLLAHTEISVQTEVEMEIREARGDLKLTPEVRAAGGVQMPHSRAR